MSTQLLLQGDTTLKLHGLINHWNEIDSEPWVEKFIHWEVTHRLAKSLDNRLYAARIESFKPLIHFDWNWPKYCEREVIDRLMELDFMKEATNLIFCGPNGAGKTKTASNIAINQLSKDQQLYSQPP